MNFKNEVKIGLELFVSGLSISLKTTTEGHFVLRF